MAEHWPPSWLKPEMLSLVLDFIQHLRVSRRHKKAMLYEWCQVVGVKMTELMVQRIFAPLEGVDDWEIGIVTGGTGGGLA